MRIRSLAACLAILWFPAAASADNASIAFAYALMPGGTPAEGFVNDSTPKRWYRFGAIAGRSYCVETQGGVHFDTGPNTNANDTTIEVVRQDQTTIIGENDDTGVEPNGDRLSRFCWIASFSEQHNIGVGRFWPGDGLSFRVRVVETTLFSNWFFVGGDYGAYTIIRNTTSSTINYRIRWRNAAGTSVHTIATSLAPNGTIYYNGATFGAVAAAVNGSVEIAFDGSPSALIASTTVLSGTTGSSFDAPFYQRATW